MADVVVTREDPPPEFIPVILQITLRTPAELQAMRAVCSLDRTIPQGIGPVLGPIAKDILKAMQAAFRKETT